MRKLVATNWGDALCCNLAKTWVICSAEIAPDSSTHSTATNTAIRQLQESEANNKKRLARLQTETQRIDSTLAERETLIESLQHDDSEIQAWADTPLPDALIRLRHRDAATGEGDYHSELSGRHPVYSAGSESDN